jgi:hypothetical protein
VCANIFLSDTFFYFVDTIDANTTFKDTLQITSSGDEFCFFIDFAVDTIQPGWITFSPDSSCTPAEIELAVNTAGLEEGNYWIPYVVIGDTTVCDPGYVVFTVEVEVVDTTTPPPIGDTLTVATVPAVPGAQVVVPLSFANECDLIGILVWLEWYNEYLELDSVSWVDTRLQNFVIKIDSIFNDFNSVFLLGTDDTAVVSPGYGNFVNLHFSVAVETPAGFYPIDLKLIDPVPHPAFTVLCPGQPMAVVQPVFIPGGIVVDTTANYVCGYVVDTNGLPIAGATVELWGDFPVGTPESTVTTNGSGAFAFSGFTVVPFDLWAYKQGYYPGLESNLNFGQSGIMITLTPVDPPYPTPEWVNFFCDVNIYMGEPMPVGSVVDAYDPDGVHCGTFFVVESGQYGFMPVYADDPYNAGDQGAEPGDAIRFFVNGVEAVATGNTIWTQHADSWEVCLEAGRVVTQTCDLFAGWNLVSWHVDPPSEYILDVMQTIDTCIDVVLGFEQGGLTYDPDLPATGSRPAAT